MPLDLLDLAKAGIVAVLEHHVPAVDDDATAKRIAALIELLADELAMEILLEQGLLPLSTSLVVESVSMVAAEVLAPTVLASLRRLSTSGETRH